MSIQDVGTDLNMKRLGEQIKLARMNYTGMTQEELCAEFELRGIPLNVKKLSRIESGKQEPSFSFVVQFALIAGSGGLSWQVVLQNIVEGSLSAPLMEEERISLQNRRSLLLDLIADHTAIISAGLDAYEGPELQYRCEAEGVQFVCFLAEQLNNINSRLETIEATTAPEQDAAAIDEP